MLTSSGNNGIDQFIPAHHVALITQPVLAARSRAKKNRSHPSNDRDKWSSTNSNTPSESPALILPIKRMDFPSNPHKTNSTSHHESSDSGIDLSLSTNSSVQVQQYPPNHLIVHRPLSALDEDSNPDEGFSSEHQQNSLQPSVRLRFPPLSLGRNRSMEDMLTHSNREQQDQHRSSSFSDERQEKFTWKQEQQMKRSSDGILLDIFSPTSKYSSQIHSKANLKEQYRLNNEVTQKNSRQVLTTRHESNLSTEYNNLPTTHAITRKPNTITLKPLRKKSKLNLFNEPPISLTSSRLHHHDEQMNHYNATNTNNNNSSNQTTPRSIRPFNPQSTFTLKTKTTPIPSTHHPNDEPIRPSLPSRQQHALPLTIHPRRGILQQVLPFDASPSKVNNLLLRHHHQQPPSTTQHPLNSNIHGNHPTASTTHTFQYSTFRQNKATLPGLTNEEILLNPFEEQRRTKNAVKQEKIADSDWRKRSKYKDEMENQQKLSGKSKMDFGKTPHDQRNFLVSIQRHYDNGRLDEQTEEEDPSTDDDQGKSSPLEKTAHQHRYKPTIQDQRLTNRSPPRKSHVMPESLPIHRHRTIDPNQQSKLISMGFQHKRTAFHKDKTRTNDSLNPSGFDSAFENPVNQRHSRASRPSKLSLHTSETPTTMINSNSVSSFSIEQNRSGNSRTNNKSVNDYSISTKQKPQLESIHKSYRIQPIVPLISHGNDSQTAPDREVSRSTHQDKSESTKMNEKNSNVKILLQSRSPTSWSMQSDHRIDQQQPMQLSTHLSQSSRSSSSHDESTEPNSSTAPRTYRLVDIDHQVPSLTNQHLSKLDSSSQTQSYHTYPFISSQGDNNQAVDQSNEPLNNVKVKSVGFDIYTLTDREETQTSFDRQRSPSPLIHLSSKNQFDYSPMKGSSTKDHIAPDKLSNYDSDDGWSDDSAELLYVDERYITERKKLDSSSHLSTQQQQYSNHQQNVLL